ncbi:MAG: imidazolonepropionase [Gammaproteobacteria bacterium]
MNDSTLWRCHRLARGLPALPVIEDGGIVTQKEKILWVGTIADLPSDLASKIQTTHEFPGQCITPGLVDCHTHLVYAGVRAHEWAGRLSGESYESIAKKGGGIQYTVQRTQQVSEEGLFKISSQRLQAMCEAGVTTVEIKSGYGLEFETEAKILKVAKSLSEIYPVTIQKTYLGLHALPIQDAKNRRAYLKRVTEDILPKLVDMRLVDAVDAFCDHIAFTAREVETFFKAAQRFNLPLKLHAEQLSDSEGSQLAVQHQALSVDHLEYLSDAGIKALASSQTVAVLLPVAYYYLKASQKPPIEKLRAHQINMAIATDCNPGSSPTTSLLLAMNMACMLFEMTPEEAFLGVTYHAAKALGLSDRYGSLEPGKIADFAVWDIEHPIELVAHLGMNPCQAVIKEGRLVYDKKRFKSI